MITIFLDYIYWHWAVAPREILKIMNNYLIANWHRFLITQHFRTLFSPWHRQNPSDIGPKQRSFADKILDMIADLYIRLIAAGIRMLVILAGLLMELLTLILFLVLFVAWLVWPGVAIFLIMKGLAQVSSL